MSTIVILGQTFILPFFVTGKNLALLFLLLLIIFYFIVLRQLSILGDFLKTNESAIINLAAYFLLGLTLGLFIWVIFFF